MNTTKENNQDDYRSLLLLDEISRNNELTQRDLSKNLGVALGLVNSYIKNLVAKGYITISTIPRKRYRYYLTPKGFSEKTRLTYEHLRNFTRLYRVARKDFSRLFASLDTSEVKRIIFCGIDEVTEIAYLSLKEIDLELVGVVDDLRAGEKFFGIDVLKVNEAAAMDCDRYVITSFKSGDELKKVLVSAGINEERIYNISAHGWLDKISGSGVKQAGGKVEA